MPYIKEEFRDAIRDDGATPDDAGQLNYAITILCNDYIGLNGLSYQKINDVLGALEGAKLEFYRRIAVPYEDKKIKENGDVYEIA